ncbi:uncharacterized protein IL334_001700 [Kwoniella shivajii]|uniref:TLC domain-containing protein n=1 Tax=Kwoniella shivajii TaxID=564305 RepID=A0ABZ1CSP3_9TREE|nr:hypothetical protein IL334_001700 [Kwoniella shivajii]
MSSMNPLPLLGPHLPTFILSTTFFYGTQYTSHSISPRLVKKYGEFDRRTKIGWATHVVSMVHAILVIPLAIRCIQSQTLKSDPVFGYDPFVGHVFAFSSGYFLWDTLDSLMNSSIGFVVHGAACLAVFMFSFRPFLAGFGAPFLLWELSTPLLNIHWFMDKAGLSTKYPTFFLVNALLFMLVFFLARIVYGGANSLLFFHTMWTERHRIPLHLHAIYCLGNLALNALNWLWFSKMLAKMYARLQGEEKPTSSDKTQVKEESNDTFLKDDAKIGEAPTDTTHVTEEASLSLPVNPPSPIVEKSDKEGL